MSSQEDVEGDEERAESEHIRSSVGLSQLRLVLHMLFVVMQHLVRWVGLSTEKGVKVTPALLRLEAREHLRIYQHAYVGTTTAESGGLGAFAMFSVPNVTMDGVTYEGVASMREVLPGYDVDAS
jgi:hypothetical protein